MMFPAQLVSRRAPRWMWRLVLLVTNALAAASPGPATEPARFVLADTGPDWQSAPAHRSVAPNLTVDQIISQENRQARILILSSPATAPVEEPLADYARRLKRILAPGAGENFLDAPAEHFGRTGHELHFRLARDGQFFFCELFVYTEESLRRGILGAATASAAAPYSLLARLHPDAPDVITLAPLKVKQDSSTGFPISFRIIANRETRRVAHLLVSEADLPGSPPEIHLDDEIVAIDDRRAQEFDSVMKRDSELGRIFFNRHAGDEVKLDLISARTKESYSVTLRIPSGLR